MSFFSINNPNLYISLALSVVNGFLLCFCGYKFLQIIQLSGYKISGYLTWLKDTKAKYISRISMLAFLSFDCMLVLNAVLYSLNVSQFYYYIGLLFYFVITAIFLKYLFMAPKKTPLKTTWRMNRLIIALFIAGSALTFLSLFIGIQFIPVVHYSAIAITPLSLPILVPMMHLILVPFESLNRKKYIVFAKRKLAKMPDLIKIGITGSYGKTSTKYILNTILSKNYSVCTSPFSFNTPMGLTKVVLNYLKADNDVLIAEMGARQIGDIAFLADIIKPKYAILTSVGEQHLQTFGNIKNIKRTKYELIKALPKDGFAVFNGDNEICKSFAETTKINNVFTTKTQTDGAFAYAKNCQISSDGLTFMLCIKDQEIECHAKLLGKHNLENILMCSALAYELGLSLEQISQGISELKPISHRLELISQNGIQILDDSYNASISGSQSALEVLDMFEGRKIVVTPGLIELGTKEKQANIDFGKQIGEVADFCIVVNQANKDAIIEGLNSTKIDKNNVFACQNLEEAKLKLNGFIRRGDVVLFENDLPDNYT